MTDSKLFDVIIIGGSYAGLSAALALGRSLKRVLVIDGGKPCNRQTPRSHNFLTRDGDTPKEISSIARHQIEKYKTITFYDDFAVSGKKSETGFEIQTESNRKFAGKKLIFATGIRDKLPNIQGFKECWGISVIHCPYCHGYEFRGKSTGILANGEKAFHLSSLVNNLTDKLFLLTNGRPDFLPDQIRTLEKHGIKLIDSKLSEIKHESGKLNGVTFDDGALLKLDALYATVPFSQHSGLAEKLGCQLTGDGYLETDEFQKTNIHGIYACGDNSSPFRSVANAVSSGSTAGAMVNMELTHEYFQKPNHLHS